jgi:hypothetical protein
MPDGKDVGGPAFGTAPETTTAAGYDGDKVCPRGRQAMDNQRGPWPGAATEGVVGLFRRIEITSGHDSRRGRLPKRPRPHFGLEHRLSAACQRTSITLPLLKVTAVVTQRLRQ